MNNTTSHTPVSELLSALADGALGDAELDAALLACRDDSTALASWNACHLIGEVLRAPSTPAYGADARFLERFRQGLVAAQADGLMIAPPAAKPGNLLTGRPLQAPQVRGRASNDESFRWKLVAGVASVAAVAAMAWSASGILSPEAGPQVAQAIAPQQVLVASPQGPVVRDARLEELLAAHRQLGGMSALQAPSGFVQNATFDTTQGARR